MKNKILLLSFLFISFTASAQYFEVGMTWVYGQYTTQPGWPPEIRTMTIVGDTTINGEEAFVLEQTTSFFNEVRYISENGQQVFYYVGDEKRLLYDFSLNAGDTLSIKAQWAGQPGLEFDSLDYAISSTEIFNINGVELKYQFFGFSALAHVEGVGSMGYFFPAYPLADGAYTKLRCVIYPNGDILKFTDDEDCYTIVGVNDIQQSGLAIYPNPVVDELTIENKEGKSYELRIFNQQGQIMRLAEKSYTGQQIVTTNWPTGTYLVQLIVDEGVFTEVIVKE